MGFMTPNKVGRVVSTRTIDGIERPVSIQDRDEGTAAIRDPSVIISPDPSSKKTHIDLVTATSTDKDGKNATFKKLKRTISVNASVPPTLNTKVTSDEHLKAGNGVIGSIMSNLITNIGGNPPSLISSRSSVGSISESHVSGGVDTGGIEQFEDLLKKYNSLREHLNNPSNDEFANSAIKKQMKKLKKIIKSLQADESDNDSE